MSEDYATTLDRLGAAGVAFARALERLSESQALEPAPLAEPDWRSCLAATHALMSAAKAHYHAEKEKRP